MYRYRFLRFPEGKPKAMTFSYDDGCRDDVRMADTLAKYGMKGTFNLNQIDPTATHRLSAEEVKEHILDKGHEIAVHGFHHRAEGTLRPIEGIDDVLTCRRTLENEFKMIIRGMAYPDSGIARIHHCTTYPEIKHYLSDLDIVYSRTLGGDNNTFMLPADWHAWMPTAHHANANLFKYFDEFLAIDFSDKCYMAAAYPRLFYIWGHSYEFSRNNNWDLLDRICEKMSGKDDIWYATNMEIYDYVKAYESLVFSADGNRIYNPSLHTVWFCADRNVFSIKPGETLFID